MVSPTGTREIEKHLDFDFQVGPFPGLYDGPPAGKDTRKFEIDLLDWLSSPPNCFGARGTAVLGSMARGDAVYRNFVCASFPTSDTASQNEGDSVEYLPEHDQSKEHTRLLSNHLPQGVACASGDIGRCGSTYGYHTPRITVSKMLLPLTPWAVPTSWNNGLEYGDACLRNMMYDDSLECGVLTDHDTSISLQDARVLRTDRAGAMPFMALELLTGKYWRGKVARHYRHELEAFIWILAFVFLAYQDKESQRGTLKNEFRAFEMLPDHGKRCQDDFIQHWPLPRQLLKWLSRLAMYIDDATISLLASYNGVDGLWPRFVAELDKFAALDSSSFMDYLPELIADLELRNTLNLV
ncbi:hypothetical protein BJ912DRAFT_956932 [Pholiota molesta]|nr:hypothetical protein BJ912DRAFT_956932 [Pholiota molesta]